jgi:hypothetical protein
VLSLKKLILILSLTTITALTGCSKDMNNNDVYEESGNTINVNNKRSELYNEGAGRRAQDKSTNYGFVRHQKSPVLNANRTNNHYVALDREQLANIISKASTNNPGVNDAATLVTDQEVLVVYKTNSKNRNLIADQVKRSAFSVVPGWYHVYVSDNPHLMRDIEALAKFDSTHRNARGSVNALIKQMKKSPQGDRLEGAQDENGLTKEDKMNNMKK